MNSKIIPVLFIFLIAIPSLLTGQITKPEAEIKDYKGKPTVFINGKPNSLSSYHLDSPCKGDMPWVFPSGFDVYYIHVYYPVPWPEKNVPQNFHVDEDTAKLYKQYNDYINEAADRIIKNAPGAWIIVRFYIQPPEWWAKMFPNEFSICETGEACRTPSLASDFYYECACQYTSDILKYVESRPWSNRVIGYLNINIEEGCHMPVSSGYLYDHNQYMVKKWRDFLKTKYIDVNNLKAAYNDPSITFDNAEIPDDKLRGTVPVVSNILYLQSIKQNAHMRDYLELTKQLYHKRYRQLALSMNNAVDRKVLLFYDGIKMTLPGWNHNAYFGGIYDGPARERFSGIRPSQPLAYPDFVAGSGDIGVADLISDKSCYNGLWTPHDYQARGIGGVYEPEGISDSIVLRGKYFSSEMDTRGDFDIFPSNNNKNWAAVTWRNLANGFTRGYNNCYTPVFEDSLWFRTNDFQNIFKRQVEVIKESVEWPHETVPGIAIIVDDSSILETNGSGAYAYDAIMWELKMGIARCGVPHNIYLFEDLELDNFPKHKVFYFPNLFRVDDKRMEILKKKVFRDGNIIVWGPESGLSDGETINKENATKLTGFNFDFYNHNYARRSLISNFDHPITKNLDSATIIGTSVPFGPIIIPTDGTELGLAWISRGNIHQVGLAIKEWGKGAAGNGKSGKRGEGDYAAIFSSVIQIPPDMWRNIAKYAGEHIYTESNDVFMADKSIVSIHSLKSEDKVIKLPGNFKVRDVITGKIYSNKTDQIKFHIDAPETKIFLLEQ